MPFYLINIDTFLLISFFLHYDIRKVVSSYFFAICPPPPTQINTLIQKLKICSSYMKWTTFLCISELLIQIWSYNLRQIISMLCLWWCLCAFLSTHLESMNLWHVSITCSICKYVAVLRVAIIKLSLSVRQDVYMNSNNMAKPSGSAFGSKLMMLKVLL